MDWLKNLPVVGPLVARLMATHAWRSYETLDRVHFSRLAAAMTFISFLSLFPLLTVAAAGAAATLSKEQQRKLQDKLSEQVPGISEQLDLDALVQNAGTVGLIAGAVLLFTGIGWVGSMRDCLRAVWGRDDEDENPFLRKLKDAGVLLGLGAIGLASLVASGIGNIAVVWLTRQLGLDGESWVRWPLFVSVFALAVLTDFLILLYVLTLLPGVHPERRRLVVAALIGAVGFELLKALLGGYMKGVAAKTMYGAFGVPVALLLWINFTAKLLLFCAAWTATPDAVQDQDQDQDQADSDEDQDQADSDEDQGKDQDQAASGKDQGKADSGKAPDKTEGAAEPDKGSAAP